ncbi:MAG: ABC transporter permease [Clostridiales bacterium]|mgnify:CR=1 FL=1|nr:ABC transporter permease [Clostridiales bacterium]
MQCNPCKRKRSNLWEVMWPPLLTLVVVLAGWEIIVQAFHVPLVVIPAPSVIFRETFTYFASELLEDWLTTVKIVAIGYLSGVPTGIVIASILSQSKLLTKAFTPLVILLVTLPMMVVLPVYMVWVGYDVNYRAILSFIQVAAILTLNTLSGFKNVDQSKLDLAKSYGASRWQTFTKIIFPNALPEVFQGLRLGCTFSILNVIGIEFIAGKIGMGFSVQYFSGLLKTPIVWGCILIVGITGRLMFMIVQMLEKRIVTWKR